MLDLLKIPHYFQFSILDKFVILVIFYKWILTIINLQLDYKSKKFRISYKAEINTIELQNLSLYLKDI